jgi:hypothetical protein
MAPMGERLDKHFPAYRRVTYWVSIIVLLIAITSIFFIQLLGGVTVLVMYIQAYAMMHQKKTQSYYHLYLMSFFLLLAACVMSPEPEIGVVIVLFLVSSVIALCFLQLHKEVENNPERMPPSILPLSEKDLTIAAEPLKRVDVGMLASIAGIVVIVLACSGALFYATPRMQAGVLGRTDPREFRSAFTQTIELTGGGRLLQDQTAVLHAEFPEEPEGRYEGGMFWRISALNDYRNSSWSRKPFPGAPSDPRMSIYVNSPLSEPRTRQTEILRKLIGNGRVVRQSIYMDNVPQEGMPALNLVQKIQCDEGAHNVYMSWDENGDFAVSLAMPGQRRLQYDAWSEIPSFTPEQLRSAPDNYREVFRDAAYEMLTHQDLEPRTLSLVQEIVNGKDTTYDKVLAISGYFNSGRYVYTLDLPALPPEHAVDAFIHDTRRGHCEIFSSAMALMLRSLGIPTRVVAGYHGGEWNQDDRSYIVRASMAHLWVEVYFIGCGWVTFDPSPATDLGGGFAQSWLGRTITRYTLKAKMAWYRNVIAYDYKLGLGSLRELSVGIFGFGGDLFERLGHVRQYRGMVFSVLFGAIFAAFACGIATFALLRGKGRRIAAAAFTADQIRAMRLYERMRRRIEILGTDPKGKSAEELSREISSNIIGGDIAMEELFETYNESRFGGRPLPLTRYTSLLRAVKALRRADDASESRRK